MSDTPKDHKQQIEEIKAKLKGHRDTLYWEYVKSLEASEIGVSKHSRELLDEVQEIDEHLAALK